MQVFVLDRDRTHCPLPPLAHTRTGEPRRIGVELELIGPSIEAVAGEVAACFRGRVETVSRYEAVVSGDPAGDWRVELDFEVLKQWGRREPPAEPLAAAMDRAAEDLLRLGAEQVVPVEVVSPPLPMDRLGEMEALVARLRERGAKGTGAGVTHAFGLQLNPEMPATDAATVVRYLKGFLCLFDWLKWRARVDFSRRLTPYIDPFPADYVRRVVEPHYWPDRDTLVQDYLAANPTRNRPLDLLPLLLHLAPDPVRAVVADPRVKPRPALHYRLPNSEIDRPGWGVGPAWRDWLEVERLVADEGALDALCRRYARFLDQPLHGVWGNWLEEVRAWLAAR